MTCPACGAVNADGARFCSSCGTAFAPTCRACGRQLQPTDLFCSHCGTRVATTAATPTESALAADGEERKLVTILFADIVGSTTLADRLDPERLRAVMQRYFDAMRAEIEAEGGTVEKFIGDAVMAVFGVPNAHEDDPSRALRAAHAMQRTLEDVNADLSRTHDVTLQIRIGVNTGEIIATTSPAAGDAMVTGEAVIVAARLQTSAGPGQTLVAERTAQAARGFAFEEQGALDLRGKREPVRAFRLAGVIGGPTRGAPYLVAPMVGRNSELDVLRRTYTRAVEEERPHVVTIFGDAGVGKSRLVREFLDGVQDSDPAPLVLRGRCLPYGDGVTYWPLAEMLKDYAGIKDTDTVAEAWDKIREVIERLIPTQEGQSGPAGFLAYTVGVEDPAVPPRRLDPQEARRQVHQAWRTFLGALATHGPVVLVVEDIHWADPALLDLLEELGERSLGPLLFVYPSRPDLVATRPGWGGGLRNAVAVSLDPLAPGEAEQLVHLLLTIDDLPHSLHVRILERAEGNPFFLEEILRRLIDGGMVVREDDRWRASPDIESVELPDSVQGVLASRIDLLDPDDKRALQAAAVVGRLFWTGPLQLLTLGTEGRQLEARLEESLRRLEEREMVRLQIGSSFAGQTEYIFKHILTRDVAYESIPRRSRGPAHAEVGRWLEHVAGDRAGEFGELLAYHYGTAVLLSEQSGLEVEESLRSSALQWLLRASDDARRKFVLTKAERLAEDAIDLARTDVEQCDALTALAEAYMTEIRGDLAWQYYVRAAAVADASPDIPDLRAARLISQAVALPIRWPGSMHMVVPEPEVRTLVDRGLELAGTTDSRERASLLATSASWPFAYPTESHDTPEAYAARGLQAAEIAVRIGDYDLACGCYDAASAVYSSVGDYRSSQELWQRRWDIRDKVTDDLEIVDIYGMGAWHAWEMGEYEAAVRYANALSGRTEHGGANHAQAWGGVGLFRLGRFDEVIATYEASRAALDTRRDDPPNYMSHLYAAAAIVHELRGERREADRITAIVNAIPEFGVRVHGWRIELALLRGDNERAARMLAEPPVSWQIHASVLWEVRCDAVLTFHEWDRAAGVAADARAYAEASGPRSVVPVADRAEGFSLVAKGDVAQGVELLRVACAGLSSLGMVWELARTRRLLAAALSRDGQGEAAQAEQGLADAELRRLRVHRDRVIDAALAAL